QFAVADVAVHPLLAYRPEEAAEGRGDHVLLVRQTLRRHAQMPLRHGDEPGVIAPPQMGGIALVSMVPAQRRVGDRRVRNLCGAGRKLDVCHGWPLFMLDGYWYQWPLV